MKFYVLNYRVGDPAETDCYYGANHNYSDAPWCNMCKQPIGPLAWEPPYKVEIRFWGKEYADIVHFSVDILISERFLRLYCKAKLKGLKILGPVEVIKVIPKRMIKDMPKYYVARIKRSKAIFDMELSEAKYKGELCKECNIPDDLQSFRRIVIREETWTGEDIFYPKGLPATEIVTERFAEFCQVNSIRNVNLTEALKYSYDYYKGKNLDRD
jgi:hypothetical protein